MVTNGTGSAVSCPECSLLVADTRDGDGTEKHKKQKKKRTEREGMTEKKVVTLSHATFF